MFEPLTKPGVFAAKLVEIGVRGLGKHGFGAASLRLERLEGTRIPLAAPIGQGLTSKGLRDAGWQRSRRYPRRGRSPPGCATWQPQRTSGAGAVVKIRATRQTVAEPSSVCGASLLPAACVGSIGPSVVGHNHDVVLLCPSLNSQGAGVSSSLAQRALPLSRNYPLKFFGNTGVSARTGNSYGLVGILVQYRWGAGL